MSEDIPPILVVRAWHEALNDRDLKAVLRLSDSEIEIVGPRGMEVGLDALRSWLDTTRLELHPRRAFTRGDMVVMEQHGVWRSPDTGEVVGEAEVASVFRVREERIASYARHDDLQTALDRAGLGASDEV